MAQQAVISSQFCSPYPLDLAMVKQRRIGTAGNFDVQDANGNLLLKIRGTFLSSKRVLFDATGKPLVTLRPKIFSNHSRWKAFRGDSKVPSDLIFSAKRSSIFQYSKTKLSVFLANNTTEELCDFSVKTNYWESKCVIYAGTSSTVLAEMRKKHRIHTIFSGKETFLLTITPNTDYAFIAALILILDEIVETARIRRINNNTQVSSGTTQVPFGTIQFTDNNTGF